MSSKRRPPRGDRSLPRQTRPQDRLISLTIPSVVGLIVLALIVGVILSLQRPATTTPLAVNTAQPRPTQAIPYPNVPRISVHDAQNELAEGRAVLVDVRSKSSYDSAHAAGAISLPEEEIAARLDELPRDKDVILYCT